MTDPRGILQQFLELCSSEINRLDDQLASNAILEWKGVTVKGRPRIVKFLRNKHQDGLVQRFTNASTVAAFEERETHMSTMITPTENLIAHSSNPSEPPVSTPEHKSSDKPDMNLSFETPPRLHPISSEPPPLTGGRRFVPFSSSDEEEDEPDPNRERSPTPSLDQPRQNVYSELQYLEAIGTVRSSHESKHRGTRTTHHIPREASSPTRDGTSTPIPATSPSSSAPDQRTKLKLSYRKHVHTQEHQFALIIYEDLTPRSTKVRRNLFCDEQQPIGTEPQPDAPEASSPTRLQPTTSDSPEARPLPDTPPPVPSPPPAEVTPPHTPLEPPGTPHRQRRFAPPGRRTSPRRSRTIMNFTIATDDSPTSSSSSSGSNNNNNNTLQTWPRKNHPTGGSPGGSAAKNRKLATGTSTVRKPLRF